MSFGEKLNNTLEYLIRERGINARQLHKYTGIPLSTLHRLRLKKENNPTLASLIPISEYFDVTVEQLIGTHPLEKKNLISEGIEVPIIVWRNALKCKKDRREQASSSLFATDDDISGECYALIIKRDQKHQWSNILAGSLLIVDPRLEPNNRDFAIVSEKGVPLPQLYQVLILEKKRYLKISDSKSEIIPFTNTYKSLGAVTQIRMNYKNNRTHVNVKDKKASRNAQKY